MLSKAYPQVIIETCSRLFVALVHSWTHRRHHHGCESLDYRRRRNCCILAPRDYRNCRYLRAAARSSGVRLGSRRDFDRRQSCRNDDCRRRHRRDLGKMTH